MKQSVSLARATGGSHIVFNRAGLQALTVPRRKPVKEHYVNEALAIIDQGTLRNAFMSITAATVAAEIARLKTLPYTRELKRNSDGTWFARVLELRGCMSEGDTQAEALDMLDGAMTGWLTAELEDGAAIPEPIAPEDFPGKVLVRMSRSLHRDLARRAEAEGVSLNQYVVTALAALRF